jgi:hypothetical protein
VQKCGDSCAVSFISALFPQPKDIRLAIQLTGGKPGVRSSGTYGFRTKVNVEVEAANEKDRERKLCVQERR